MKRIILTGGGTAGHVTPNIALLPRLKELQYDIHYIGSYTVSYPHLAALSCPQGERPRKQISW